MKEGHVLLHLAYLLPQRKLLSLRDMFRLMGLKRRVQEVHTIELEGDECMTNHLLDKGQVDQIKTTE